MKSSIIKGATLFNQNLYMVGLSDVSSEAKIQGISGIMGVFHDEAVLWLRGTI
jgi:hypothetical protein